MPRINKKSKKIEEIVQDYIDYCNYKNLRPKTIKSYYQTLMLFARYLEEEMEITDIKKIDKDVVEKYLSLTKERGKYSFIANEESLSKNRIDNRKDVGEEVSATTINNYLRNIKAFFSYLEENQIIKENSVRHCDYLKAPRKSKEQLTDYEYEKFIKAIDLTKFHEYRDYVIINLIFDTGMRLSETLSLTIHDIDLVRRTIYIPAEVTKGRKDRVTFFSITMSKLLNRWIRYKDTMQESELLFPTQRTNGLLSASNFERNFRQYLRRVNIDKNITPHGLRNNFSRRFLMSGGDIYTLSKILGHSSVTVTEKAYLDLMDEDFRKRYQRFSPLDNMKK